MYTYQLSNLQWISVEELINLITDPLFTDPSTRDAFLFSYHLFITTSEVIHSLIDKIQKFKNLSETSTHNYSELFNLKISGSNSSNKTIQCNYCNIDANFLTFSTKSSKNNLTESDFVGIQIRILSLLNTWLQYRTYE